MTKTEKRATAGSYRSMGTTPDGVTILAPKLAPTHFKAGQIRSTIAKLGRNATTGQLELTKEARSPHKRPKT